MHLHRLAGDVYVAVSVREMGENEMKDMFVSLHLTQPIERPPAEGKNWLLSANKAIGFQFFLLFRMKRQEKE